MARPKTTSDAAPSKSPSKSPKKSTALDINTVVKPTILGVKGRGHLGFRSLEEYQWFDLCFKERRVMVERPMKVPIVSEDPFYVQVLRSRRGWLEALSEASDANLTVVREFSASLIEIDEFHFQAFVRGKTIDITPATLARFLKIAEVGNFQCPFHANAVSPTPMEVASELTGTDFLWESGRLLVSALTEEYQALLRVVQNSILPTSNNADITFEIARIVFAIGTGMRVDLVRLYMKEFWFPSDTKAQNVSIKPGALITRLCKSVGVSNKDGDEIVKAKTSIGQATDNRSKGQRKRAREPNVVASDEDGEQRTKHRHDPSVQPSTSVPIPVVNPVPISDELHDMLDRILGQQQAILAQLKEIKDQQSAIRDSTQCCIDTLGDRLANIEQRLLPFFKDD